MAHEPGTALAVYEIDGIATALVAQDAALKRARVVFIACAPTSPGKVVLVFHGEVASVEEARAAVAEVAGSRQIDALYLPGAAPEILDALRGHEVVSTEALGVLELASVAALLAAADAGVKAAAVQIGRMHAASGYGGRGYVLFVGPQHAVEAALEAAEAAGGDRVLDRSLIAQPHVEMALARFVRAWPSGPARRP